MPGLTADDLDKAVRHLRRRDPVLASVIQRTGPCVLKRQTRRFESLAGAIVSQQISTSAAKSIWGRLSAAVKPRAISAESLAALPDDVVRQCGVSPQKLGYLRDLQARTLSRDVRLNRLHHLSDEDVITELVRIKGIGVWTAQMFLMFSLGRPDVLPHLDLGIRSAIRKLYQLEELPDRETCERHAEPWRPYATVACWYLWRSVDQ